MSTHAVIERDVIGCARCGEDHRSIVFRKLLRPADDFAYWATCPVTGEPILMQTSG